MFIVLPIVTNNFVSEACVGFLISSVALRPSFTNDTQLASQDDIAQYCGIHDCPGANTTTHPNLQKPPSEKVCKDLDRLAYMSYLQLFPKVLKSMIFH